VPYFYFDDDDQIHYVKSLHELPEYLFGDTQPIEDVSFEDGGEWTLDRALAAFDEDDEEDEQS